MLIKICLPVTMSCVFSTVQRYGDFLVSTITHRGYFIYHIYGILSKNALPPYLYIAKMCDKKCKTFGRFTENFYFCQQKNLKPSIYVRGKRDFEEE